MAAQRHGAPTCKKRSTPPNCSAHLQVIAVRVERGMKEISADDLMVGPHQRMALEWILSVTITQVAIV